MKLLLTSAGLTTSTLRTKLGQMAGRPPAELQVAFIPTAANLESGDKRWLLDDLQILKNDGYQSIDLVDISALPKSVWLGRLLEADIIVVSGGNTYHLLYWVKKSGLAQELPNLLKDRIYVGISAGSIIVGSSLALCSDEASAAKKIGEDPGEAGLGLVNFVVEPHLNNVYFPEVTKKRTEEFALQADLPTYLLDDTSAVVVDEGVITILGQENYCFQSE